MMNASFSDWYRSAGMNPPEGLLESRWTTIDELAKKADSKSVVEHLRLFALPNATEALVPAGMREAFRATDDTFPSKGNLLELQVLSGAILRLLVDEGGKLGVTTALGLVCASFFTRLDTLPEKDHVEAAEQYLIKASKSQRTSPGVPRISSLTFPKERYQQIVPGSSFTAAQMGQLHEQLFLAFDEVVKAVAISLSRAGQAVESLERIVAAQKEELNILWWLQTETSSYTNTSFKDVGLEAGSLLFPVELADRVVFTNGADAVPGVLRQALEKSGASAGSAITIATAVNSTSKDWREEIAKRCDVSAVGELLPILLALHTSLQTHGEDEWLPVYRKACDISANDKMPLLQFSLQAYREIIFLKFLQGQ